LGTLRGHWRDICIDLEGIRHVNGGRLVVTPPGGFGWSFLSQDGDDSKTDRTDRTVFPKNGMSLRKNWIKQVRTIFR
jgi:hypothetical protein